MPRGFRWRKHTFAQVMRDHVSNRTYGPDQRISLTTWQRAYLII
jgi:hypothetical protein